MKRAAGRRLQTAVWAVAVACIAVGCGKKGDPQPPLPRGPSAVSDLSAEQEGDDAVLTFRFPDRLLTGAPLTDLQEIEVYRVVRPPSSMTSPRKTGATPGGQQSGTNIVVLPGAAERHAATNTRLAEEAFYQLAEKIATLPLSEIAERTQGASVVYKDPLSPLFAKEKKPEPLAYAVISVRRGGSRSPLSNIATLDPDVAAEAPVLLPAMPLEGRICLDWLPPQNDVLGRPVEIGGYEVYRRILPEEEYERPLNPKPIAAASYVDVGAPYGAPLVYTVRAVLAKNPKVEGLPAEEMRRHLSRHLPAGRAVAPRRAVRGQPRAPGLEPGRRAGPGRLPRVPHGSSAPSPS